MNNDMRELYMHFTLTTKPLIRGAKQDKNIRLYISKPFLLFTTYTHFIFFSRRVYIGNNEDGSQPSCL